MASIPGSVPLSGKVAPTDTTDTFATHVDIYGEGGYMTVADQAERDAITAARRKQGMAVYVNADNKLYVLKNGVTNNDWVEFSGSGGGDLQSVLEGGSQFARPNGYTGGILSINYSGVTGDPSDPTLNSTGILIDGNSTGTNTGENLVIAASGSADAGFITLHAQNVNSLPAGPVPYSRLEIGEGNIAIDTNSTNWQNASVGDILSIKSINPGVGTNGSQYIIGTGASTLAPSMQTVYNNSPQVVSGLDTSKPLTLINGEINLDARISATQTGIANIKGEEGVRIQGYKPITGNLSPSGGADVQITSFDGTDPTHGGPWTASIKIKGGNWSTDSYLKIAGIRDNVTGSVEVGDVLVVDSITGTGLHGYEADMRFTPSAIKNIKLTLTPAEISNLHTTPIDLIPAPPINRFIVVFSVYSFLDFNTTPYTTQTGSQLRYRYSGFGANYVTLFNEASLQQSTDVYRAQSGAFPFNSVPPGQAWGPNQSVELYAGAAITNGDSPITFYVSYAIKNL